MKQQDHWDYIMETLTTAFNEEYQYIKEHVEKSYQNGFLEERQDDNAALQVTRDNLIYAIEGIYSQLADNKSTAEK